MNCLCCSHQQSILHTDA